jgi:predicted nuclease of predicted toxin-antitoxin system
MKFLLDARLPPRLAARLRSAGYQAIHTRDLTLGNRTPDSTINELSLKEQLIVITKDADFVNSFVLKQTPYKLLLISTGNMSNTALEALLLGRLKELVVTLTEYSFVELECNNVIIHD